jgi:hypothetical protein
VPHRAHEGRSAAERVRARGAVLLHHRLLQRDVRLLGDAQKTPSAGWEELARTTRRTVVMLLRSTRSSLRSISETISRLPRGEGVLPLLRRGQPGLLGSLAAKCWGLRIAVTAGEPRTVTAPAASVHRLLGPRQPIRSMTSAPTPSRPPALAFGPHERRAEPGCQPRTVSGAPQRRRRELTRRTS